jgi:hypothetical protein
MTLAHIRIGCGARVVHRRGRHVRDGAHRFGLARIVISIRRMSGMLDDRPAPPSRPTALPCTRSCAYATAR